MKFPLDFSPCSARHVTLTTLRWCCTPCVIAVTSRCMSVCVSAPAHSSSGCSSLCVSGTHCIFCWTKRKQRTPLYIPISIDELGFDTVTRVNIPLRSFREMVSQGTVMRWIATAQLLRCFLGIGPEISESVKTIYDAAKVKLNTQSMLIIDGWFRSPSNGKKSA